MFAFNDEKKNLIAYCEKILRQAELKAEKDSILLIDEYKKIKKHIFRNINQDNMNE